MRKTVFVLLLLCSVACKNTQQKVSDAAITVKIEPSKQKASDSEYALSGFDFLKLETTNKALISDISRVEICDNRIFILTPITAAGNGEVFIFDADGKYIKKLLKGRGPQEIIYPTDIAVNTDKKKLVVLDAYRKISEFDFDGKHISSTQLKSPNYYVETIKDDYLLFDPNANSSSSTLLTYHTKNDKQHHMLPREYKGGMYMEPDCFFKINSDSVLVSSIFSDVVYIIDSEIKSLRPFIQFDYGSRNANKDLGSYSDFRQYTRDAREKKNITGPMILTITGSKLFFSNLTDVFTYGVHDMSTGKTVLYDKLFKDIPNYYGRHGQVGEKMIFGISPGMLMTHFEEHPPVTEQGKKLQQVLTSENDNPVLIFGYV